jgi:16S rRNA processing protein RimM
LKSSSNTVEIGFVVRAHGLRGVVRARGGEALATVDRVWLGERDYRLLHAARDKDEWLLTLDGVDTREAAEALRGASIAVVRGAVPLADDELLVADLIGCTLFDVAGRALGEVTGSFDSGAHEVLEVRAADGNEFMVPFVAPIITAVDVAARRIDCDPPPGLIDLDEGEPDQ